MSNQEHLGMVKMLQDIQKYGDGFKKGTPMMLDFTHVVDSPDSPTGVTQDGTRKKYTADGYRMTAKSIRARIRSKRQKLDAATLITPQEATVLYKKPIEEWDSEELARGRPRNKQGTFSGPKPSYVTMSMHEESLNRFTKVIKTDMGVATIKAMEQLNAILANEDTDYRGKPLVSASTKLDAAKFLIEHLLGKPKQTVENEVSVKLQSILGSVIVNPDEDGEMDFSGYTTAHMPGVTMELATQEESHRSSN